MSSVISFSLFHSRHPSFCPSDILDDFHKHLFLGFMTPSPFIFRLPLQFPSLVIFLTYLSVIHNCTFQYFLYSPIALWVRLLSLFSILVILPKILKISGEMSCLFSALLSGPNLPASLLRAAASGTISVCAVGSEFRQEETLWIWTLHLDTIWTLACQRSIKVDAGLHRMHNFILAAWRVEFFYVYVHHREIFRKLSLILMYCYRV